MTKSIPALSSHPTPKNGVLKLDGSYKDYNILIDGDRIIVTDLRHNGFGMHKYYATFSRVAFDDVFEISLFNRNPYHVSDIVDLGNANAIEIQSASLTENDKDYYGRKISVKSVLNPVGGKVNLKDGKITFTADSAFEGIRKFYYTVANEDGFVNTKPIPVYVRELHHPNDPDFFTQWYLQDLNVEKAWQDYTGKGVKVAIYDEGFIPDNPDLEISKQVYQPNYDSHPFEQHAFAVANVIAAKHNNGFGGTGIAYDADLSSYQFPFGGYSKIDFDFFREYDVVNNSWGFSVTAPNKDEFDSFFDSLTLQLENAAIYGREGAGSNIVFSSGNQDLEGDDSAATYFTNSQYVIVVGGYSKPEAKNDTYGPNIFEFASQGSTVLISAPATDYLSPYAGNIKVSGSDLTASNHNINMHGTSFGTPAVSAIVALMLEANPYLGFRDVQDILAYAALPNPNICSTNHSTNWNGGGLLFNKKHGFGVLDAKAAVRLAETWDSVHTFTNYNQTFSLPQQFIQQMKFEKVKDSQKNVYEAIIKVSDDVLIEFAKLYLDMTLKYEISNYKIDLQSPSGTKFNILDGYGKSKIGDEITTNSNNINWEFGLQHARGEGSKGDWKLVIEETPVGDAKNLAPSVIYGYSLNFAGKNIDEPKEMFYTDAFATVYSESRSMIPKDTTILNASAVTKDVVIDLSGETVSSIASKYIEFSNKHKVYEVKAGDGNDTIIGNDKGNLIYPGRGDDEIYLGNGRDVIVYTNNKLQNLGDDVVYNFNPSADKIHIGELTAKEIMSALKNVNDGEVTSTKIDFQDWSITLNDVLKSEISEEVFIV